MPGPVGIALIAGLLWVLCQRHYGAGVTIAACLILAVASHGIGDIVASHGFPGLARDIRMEGLTLGLIGAAIMAWRHWPKVRADLKARRDKAR